MHQNTPPPPPPPRSLRSLAGGFQEIWNAPCGISVTYKMLKRCILFPNKLWISRIMVYQFSSITIPEWYGIHIDTFYHVHKIRKTRLQLTFDITPINHKSATIGSWTFRVCNGSWISNYEHDLLYQTATVVFPAIPRVHAGVGLCMGFWFLFTQIPITLLSTMADVRKVTYCCITASPKAHCDHRAL